MIIYTGLDNALNGTGGDDVMKQIVKKLYDMYRDSQTITISEKNKSI